MRKLKNLIRNAITSSPAFLNLAFCILHLILRVVSGSSVNAVVNKIHP